MLAELIETLCILVKLLTIGITSVYLFLTVKLQLKGEKAISLYAYLLVYGFYVLPLLLNLVSPYHHDAFVEANDAMKDPYAVMLYCLFITAFSIALYRTGRKGSKISASVIEYNPYVVVVGTLFMLFTFLITLWLNGISILFGYGMGYFSDGAIIITPLFSGSTIFYLVILAYRGQVKKSVLLLDTLLLLLLLWIEGKRSLIAFAIILAIFTMSISGQLKGKTVIKALGFAAVAIIAYSYLYGVFLKENVSSIREYFAIDLSRDYTLIYQIHCHRIGRMISVNHGDALLYILLFWVPRSIWPNKPYPFANSLTRSLLGLPPANENLGWATTSSIFADLYDTFNVLGFLIGIILVCKLCVKTDKSSKATTKILLVYVLVQLLTVQLSASLIAIVVCYFILKICDFLNREKKLPRRDKK